MKLKLEIEKWNQKGSLQSLIKEEAWKLKKIMESMKIQNRDLIWKDNFGMERKLIY